MIYCQLRNRVKLDVKAALPLAQVAQVTGDREIDPHLALPCPKKPGVWKLEAVEVVRALRRAYPGEEVTPIGPEVCYIHRIHTGKKDPLKPLRAAAAFAILFFGSMLGLAWFHSDVDMPRAMEMLFTLIAGEAPSNPLWITLPYVVGVGLGVCVFYAIPRKNAVTPMEVKLTEYQGDMEQTEGKDIHEGD